MTPNRTSQESFQSVANVPHSDCGDDVSLSATRNKVLREYEVWKQEQEPHKEDSLEMLKPINQDGTELQRVKNKILKSAAKLEPVSHHSSILFALTPRGPFNLD